MPADHKLPQGCQIVCRGLHIPRRVFDARLCMQACANQLGYTPATSRRCSTFSCQSDLDCSYHGSCITAAGRCSCDAGFLGPSCSVQTSDCLPSSPAASPANAPSSAKASASVAQVRVRGQVWTFTCMSCRFRDYPSSLHFDM